ncbi:hypothetical protein [Haloarcula sp. 1CSR25-25]|uniref:DUF7344 domain-containing protein n=1 Tax=Haloarcula sp. 1CSR25-25 TaxID=2862545 RepID=UPI002893D01F|nr:hypothetical protein [Haloarcula sp. 1CSR25-25]MDT3436699.1 hypothetical protein [Haloarcula sp. 1CSR25-25]
MVPTAVLDAVLATEETTVSPDQDGLDDATMFDILDNERRRACLGCLSEHETELSVNDLGRQVARVVADAETDSDDLYDSVYISLCQTHLPRLDAVGLVEYEPDRKRVRQGPRFDAIRSQFEPARTNDCDPSDTVRTGPIASVLTVLIGTAAVVGPPTARPALLLGLVVTHLLVLVLASTSTSPITY